MLNRFKKNDNLLVQIKRFDFKENLLFIEGIGIAFNKNAKEFSDIKYQLLFNGHKKYVKSLAKSHKPYLTKEYGNNRYCYDKCWFTTYDYKGLDISDIQPDNYQLYLRIVVDDCEFLYQIKFIDESNVANHIEIPINLNQSKRNKLVPYSLSQEIHNRSFYNDPPNIRKITSYIFDIKNNFNPDYTKDRLCIYTNTDSNFIRLARKDTKTYNQYIEIISNGFVLIDHRFKSSYFRKISAYHPENTKKLNLSRYQDVLYTLTPPPLKRNSESLPNKLLVLFTHINAGKLYDTKNAIQRLFLRYFESIQRSLIKNVYVLRIADMNLSHGSYYCSTANFPTFENEIQELISEIRDRFDIKQDNVVCYGGSKGGAGALVHAALGDYKAVVSDPIINSAWYDYDKNDLHFVKNFKPSDLTDKILNSCQNNSSKIYVFASENVPFNYKASINLANNSNKLIEIVDISNDSEIKSHPHVTSHSVPEQLTLINLLLDGDKLVGEKVASSINHRGHK